MVTKAQHFGVTVKEARLAQNMSRETLAVLTGTTSDAIRDYEENTGRDPRWSTLARICAVLQIPMDEVPGWIEHAVVAARNRRPESPKAAKALKEQQERMRKRHLAR